MSVNWWMRPFCVLIFLLLVTVFLVVCCPVYKYGIGTDDRRAKVLQSDTCAESV